MKIHKEISKLLANRQHRLDRLEGHCLVPAFGVQARPIGYVPALLLQVQDPDTVEDRLRTNPALEDPAKRLCVIARVVIPGDGAVVAVS